MATETAPRPVHRVAKELVASSGFLLARLGMAFKSKALARIEQEGFDAHHYSVLALLDSLEQRGLVVRQRDPQDRRRHVVNITPAGSGELQRLRSIAKQLEDE